MKMDYIVTAYNEEKNIKNIITEIRDLSKDRIIVIDDGSKDKTYDYIPKVNNLIKIKNSSNKGKGYSVKRALSYCNADYICIVDGDIKGVMRHIKFLEPIIKEYDCIVLTPPIKGGGYGIFRKYSRYVVNRRTSADIPWCLSGVRIIKREALEKIKEKISDRFAFEVSMIIELINSGYKIRNFDVEFTHDITKRDIKGFYHRGRQFLDVLFYSIKTGK